MNNNQLYKLSPSDFKYLWEECKHCFYRKVHFGIIQPSIGMPGIFSKMSKLLQDSLKDTNPKDLHPDLSNGRFIKTEGFLKSVSIPESNKSFINGRFDLLAEFDDGSHGLIDVKITDPNDSDLYKFGRQLHAYKFALENPFDESLKIVKSITRMGLLIISPKSIEIKDSNPIYHTEPVWFEIEENMPRFFKFISDIEEVLCGPEPKLSSNCKWCQFKSPEKPF
ncbi:MAG: PD-(D/E)XK nuclease family protein [Patescibacteria group bacterium]